MGSDKDTGHLRTAGFYIRPESITFHCVTLNTLADLRSLGFPICKEEILLSALQSHSEGSLRSKQWLLQEALLSLRVWGGNVKVRTWGLKQRCRGRQDDSVEPVPGSLEISGHEECRPKDKVFRQGRWQEAPC